MHFWAPTVALQMQCFVQGRIANGQRPTAYCYSTESPLTTPHDHPTGAPIPMKLPIKLNDLLRQRTVESERIEYKAGWNPDAILRTLCAFANDFANLGGGYVVIGQDCDANGRPVFPPVGLAENQLDKIQRELLAHCQLIQPPYFPTLGIEEVQGRKLIVLWAPGGQTRPYKVPTAVTAKHKTWHHYIRRYASTVEPRCRSMIAFASAPESKTCRLR
jgi:predicted HTH transcriptional regulator